MSKVFSGFSTNNYIQIGNYFPQFNTLKIIIKANSTNFSSHNVLFWSNKGWFGVRSNSYPSIYVNSSWVQGSSSIQTNKDYWFCLDYSDGINFNYYTLLDNNYTLSTLPSLENWTYQCKTTTNFLTSYRAKLGYNDNSTSEYWRGTIYDCKVFLDSNTWFDLQTAGTSGYIAVNCVVSQDEGWANFRSTNSQYFRTTNNFAPGSGSWEIDFSFCTGSNISAETSLIAGNSTTFFDVAVYQDKLLYWLSGNGSSWNLANNAKGTQVIMPETKYYIKFIYDSTNQLFETYISTDNLNYVLDYSKSGVMYTGFNNYLKFGLDRSGNYPFNGTISLKSIKIYLDSVLWFDGSTAVDTTDYIIVGNLMCVDKPHIACNFSRSQYLRLNPIPINNNDSQHTGIIRTYFIHANASQDILSNTSRDKCIVIKSDDGLDFYNGSHHYSKSVFTTNNWYWVGYTWNGKTYKLYSMKDNGIYTSYTQLPPFTSDKWTLETSFDDKNNIFAEGFVMGMCTSVDDSNRYFRGMFDLNNCILGNNVIYYKANKVGYISQSNYLTIDTVTTKNITLSTGITLAIEPTPADATVELWAEDYQQTDGSNTLTAIEGTLVNYKVSKKRYLPQNGTYTLTSSNTTLSVALEEYPYTEPFVQPILSANGSMGGDAFACNQSAAYSSTTVAWRCFKEWDGVSDGESERWQINSVSTSNYYYIEWYNPTELLIDKLTIYNAQSNFTVSDYILQGSNDYSSWTDIISGRNDNTAERSGWEINLESNLDAYKYFRLQCKPNSGTSLQICKIYISGYTA